MSFTRPKYDNCSKISRTNRSVEPGNYRLLKDFAVNTQPCYNLHGIIGAKNENNNIGCNYQNIGQVVDIESCLNNRSRPLSDCSSNNCDLSKFTPNLVRVDCQNPPHDTRFVDPPFRGISLTTYNMNPYLPIDPQCNIFYDYSISSRLVSKDTFQQPPQNMWDNGSALPNPLPDEQKPRCSVCCNK